MAKKQSISNQKAKGKRSVIISYDKTSDEIKLLLAERYPDGYANYIIKYPKPDGTFFFAVSLDTDEANYLIKVDVKIDNVFSDSDFDKGLDLGNDFENKDFGAGEESEDIDEAESNDYPDVADDDNEE